MLHKHGYDVLTKNDQEFKEKLDSYNRVFELQAKKNGLTSYTKYELEELCVCGDYMFVENDYNLPSKEVDIKDALFYVQFFGTSNEEKEKYSKLIRELYNKIPGSSSREY